MIWLAHTKGALLRPVSVNVIFILAPNWSKLYHLWHVTLGPKLLILLHLPNEVWLVQHTPRLCGLRCMVQRLRCVMLRFVVSLGRWITYICIPILAAYYVLYWLTTDICCDTCVCQIFEKRVLLLDYATVYCVKHLKPIWTDCKMWEGRYGHSTHITYHPCSWCSGQPTFAMNLVADHIQN